MWLTNLSLSPSPDLCGSLEDLLGGGTGSTGAGSRQRRRQDERARAAYLQG